MKRNAYASITLAADNSTLQFASSYNRGLIADLKAQVPYTDRKWEPTRKVWLVAPKYGQAVADLATQYLGVAVKVPQLRRTQQPITRAVKVEYIGSAKDRDDGQVTATGYADGSWSVIFPVDVLKAWFDPDHTARPGEQTTLYGTLGVGRESSQTDIKKAHRRAALHWHPDRNKEPDAAEQFMKIQNAYEVLSDELGRKKYNAGLILEASLKNNNYKPAALESMWRPPLRCGYILAEGLSQVGRFVISKIVAWEDITDDFGRTMISSWQSGDGHFTIEWI